MLKKLVIGSFVVGFLLVLFINFRTPFFTEIAGPWSVGYGFSKDMLGPIHVSDTDIFEISDLDSIEKGSKLLADPFFIHEKDTFYLFVEHITGKSNGANISVLTSVDGKNYTYKGNVLDEEFHLSYPQVFKHKDSFYMVPESKNAGHILLYKTEKFPFDWKVQDTLVKNVRMKDPSIYLSDTLNIMVASNDELVMTLYKSDGLHAEWKPVKSILRGSEARAGGRIFSHNNKLYLPMQNSAKGYGHYLSLYEFVFDGDDIRLEEVKDKILSGQPDIPAFSWGMHQLDIQPVGDAYYQVYDGTRKVDGEKVFNARRALKVTYVDFLNLFN